MDAMASSVASAVVYSTKAACPPPPGPRDAHRCDLAVAVEPVPDVRLRQGRGAGEGRSPLPPVRVPHVQRGDSTLVPRPSPPGRRLLRPLPLQRLLPPHHLLGDRIGGPVEPVLGVLLGERVVPVPGHLVPERAGRSPVALPLGEEAAELGQVALVPGLHPRHGPELEVGPGPRHGPRGPLLDGALHLGRVPGAVGVALRHGHGRRGPSPPPAVPPPARIRSLTWTGRPYCRS